VARRPSPVPGFSSFVWLFTRAFLRKEDEEEEEHYDSAMLAVMVVKEGKEWL
jgi:hypothetical protein